MSSNECIERRTWRTMLYRCSKMRCKSWPSYGGRGIRVCDRWLKFENFLADMGRRPSASHSIDRVDNNGNYEPGNCRWATAEQQGSNNRRTKLVAYEGRMMATRAAARRAGLLEGTVHNRISLGWDTQRALTTRPVDRPPVTFAGETLSQYEWARRFGVSRNAIYYRISRGMTPEEAVAHFAAKSAHAPPRGVSKEPDAADQSAKSLSVSGSKGGQ